MNRGWLELESDPGLFTLLVENFGVKGVQVEEVYDLQKPIEGPVYGFIFLFKWIEERRSRRKVQPLTDETFVDDESIVNGMFFAQQLIPNSCATHALLSILLNCPNITLGPTLMKLRDFTKNFNPENKGYAIGSLAELARAHNSHAKPEPRHIQEKQMGISAVRTMETFHFVSYVPIKARLFELDGLKPYPIDHGPWGEHEEWTDKFRRVIKERLDMGGCDIRFNLMAVVADRRQAYEQKLKLLKSNEYIMSEALQQLIKYSHPSLLLEKPVVPCRDPVVTRSKQLQAKILPPTKPPKPVKEEKDLTSKPKPKISKAGNNRNNTRVITSYRPPPALDTHNYAKSPLSEHDDTCTEDSTASDEEEEEEEEDDDSETESDEEVNEQRLPPPPPPPPEPPVERRLSTSEVARHLRQSESASKTLIQISIDPITSDPGLFDDNLYESFLSKVHLLPEVKLLPNAADTDWQPLTIQTDFNNKCSSPSPCSESTDTASEFGSAFNSPARSAASSPRNCPSPNSIIAQFREWKENYTEESEREVAHRDVEMTDEKDCNDIKTSRFMLATIPEHNEETEESPSQSHDVDMDMEKNQNDLTNDTDTTNTDQQDDAVGQTNTNCKQENDTSTIDESMEEAESQTISQRTFHPKDLVLIVKNLQSEIGVCEQRLCDENEKRKKYQIDDCRRTHNYDPFITTFLSMLAEQDQLAGLVEQHMTIRRRQGYSLGRLHKTSKPERRRRSRPSLKKKAKK
ncbi:ubiquitin carboxyl-terminal hydrolase BAP1-like [Glandiceps talaboti]